MYFTNSFPVFKYLSVLCLVNLIFFLIICSDKGLTVLFVEKISLARFGATLWSALEEEFEMRRNYFHNGVVTIVLWFVLVVKRVHMTL